MCTCGQMPQKSRSIRSPQSWVTGDCEFPDKGSGNRAQVPCKSRKCSQPRASSQSALFLNHVLTHMFSVKGLKLDKLVILPVFCLVNDNTCSYCLQLQDLMVGLFGLFSHFSIQNPILYCYQFSLGTSSLRVAHAQVVSLILMRTQACIEDGMNLGGRYWGNTGGTEGMRGRYDKNALYLCMEKKLKRKNVGF